MALTLNKLVYDVKNIAYGGYASDDAKIGACEVDLGTHVLKSIHPIPRTVQRNERDSILAVESLDGQRAFSETTAFRKKWNQYNKYTGSKNRWYVKDSYLYVICDMLIDAVKLTGVFEDAQEVWLHNRCLDQMGGLNPDSVDYPGAAASPDYLDCEYSWDTPFPISMTLAESVTSMILQKRMQITLSLPNDETNNAKGDGAQNMQSPAGQ